MRSPQILEYSCSKSFCLLTLALLKMLRALQQDKHIANYGIGNERRLTGKDDTASINDFSWGAVSERGAVGSAS